MDFSITLEEQKILLAQARESIAAKLEGRKPLFEQLKTNHPVFNMPCGAFVSLHKVNDGKRSLRGCIGRMSANLPFIETIRLMAKEAAFGDPRFPDLKIDELTNCLIEISALSPMVLCPDPKSVKVGVHGLYLIFGGRSGVLLPQVPVEQKWDQNEYLEYICIKAGVPPGSYNSPGAQLFTFTAIVFAEE